MFNQDNQDNHGMNQPRVNHEAIKKFAVNFARSRSNLLIVVALTTLNIFLHLSGSDFYMLFSATLPTLVTIFADIFGGFATDAGTVGIIIAFAIIFFYCLCWLLSKRHKVFILIAMIFFAIDTLIYLYVMFIWLGYFGFTAFIELAFHAWIMYYLIIGTVAWWNLKEVSNEDVASALAAANALTADAEANAALKKLQEEQESKQEQERDKDK